MNGFRGLHNSDPTIPKQKLERQLVSHSVDTKFSYGPLKNHVRGDLLAKSYEFTSSEGEADERTEPEKQFWDLNRKTLGRSRDDRIFYSQDCG